MPLAVALIVLVVGSLLFHFLSPWTFTPIASNWGTIDNQNYLIAVPAAEISGRGSSMRTTFFELAPRR